MYRQLCKLFFLVIFGVFNLPLAHAAAIQDGCKQNGGLQPCTPVSISSTWRADWQGSYLGPASPTNPCGGMTFEFSGYGATANEAQSSLNSQVNAIGFQCTGPTYVPGAGPECSENPPYGLVYPAEMWPQYSAGTKLYEEYIAVARTANLTTGYYYSGGCRAFKEVKCPIGSSLTASQDANGSGRNYPAFCLFQPRTDPKNHGVVCGPEGCGDPIHAGTGNKFQSELDYLGINESPLKFERYYNSSLSQPYIGTSGQGWRTTYDRSISPGGIDGSFSAVTVYRADGRLFIFKLVNSVYKTDVDIYDRLEAILDGANNRIGWRYIDDRRQEIETYDANGRLNSIVNSAGISQVLTYDGSGRLGTVVDSFGRTLTLGYDEKNRINTLKDPAGQTYQYEYDAKNNLTLVRYPDLKTRTYLYNEPNLTYSNSPSHLLTGIVDENGKRFVSFPYIKNTDSPNQPYATGSAFAGDAGKVTIAYPAFTSGLQASVTDALGKVRTYTFSDTLGRIKLSSISPPCNTCAAKGISSLAYDANGNVNIKVDANNNQTQYIYAASTDREITRREGMTNTPQGSSPYRIISTEWHPQWRLPKRIAEPKRITTYVYNGDIVGGVAISCSPKSNLPNGFPIAVLCSKSIQATSDTGGGFGFDATPEGTPRVWRYTYNGFGQILTFIGPRNDVVDKTIYSYDDANGNLLSVTNPAGHITRFYNHDGNGRVGTIVDANNLSTTLTYYPRGWIQSKRVAGNGIDESTSYEYDDAGQLTKASLPDGSVINYKYDDAHRLTDISDKFGNTIHYTLDVMGNKLSEEVRDASGALSRQISRIYDDLNHLQKVTGAAQ